MTGAGGDSCWAAGAGVSQARGVRTKRLREIVHAVLGATQ